MRTISSVILFLITILFCCPLLIFTEPSYTVDKPDTPENKKGFESHFDFPPSPDVVELYYYADQLGIDASYQLGFKADHSTIDKITTNLKLKQLDETVDEGISDEFPWWQKSDLQKLKPYWKQSADGRLHQYLWYDEVKKQAWYLDFDF